MKSMLQEAATIAKAVEQAWQAAGKPEEFTIKVVDQGERGFLGLTTVRPAVVSIMYEPGRSASRKPYSGSQRTGRHNNKEGREPIKHVSAEEVLRGSDQPRRQQQPRKQERPQQERQQRQPQRQPQQDNQTQGQPQHENQSAVLRPLEGQPFWNAELIGDIESSLKEILTIMNVTSPFGTSFERQLLTINFSESTIDEPEAEKMLYTSVSYLLLQFLKKKHRRRFKGYRILMISPTCGNAPVEKDED